MSLCIWEEILARTIECNGYTPYVERRERTEGSGGEDEIVMEKHCGGKSLTGRWLDRVSWMRYERVLNFEYGGR